MDEQRQLTGAEKRAQLKEQYKAELRDHLKKTEELKRAQKQGQVARQLDQALSQMTPETNAAHQETDEWTNRLNQTSAQSEARLDMALEQLGMANPETTKPPDPASDEGKTLGNLTSKSAPDPVKEPENTKTLGDWEV